VHYKSGAQYYYYTYIPTYVYIYARVYRIQFAHLTRYMQRYYVQAWGCYYLDLPSEATPRRRVSNTQITGAARV
jgi:hypothetical protein